MTEYSAVYVQVVRDLLDRAAASGQPASGTFELTSGCNLACGMCYVKSPDGGENSQLDASAWVELAKRAVLEGMVFLTLTGGEIFLRSDFFRIYQPLRQMGVVLTLLTNGTLISEPTAKRLAAAPPNLVKVTLYGANEATYGIVTGSADAYRRCLKGIEALLANKVPLELKATLTRQNLGELAAMQSMARDWGVPIVASWLLSGSRDPRPTAIERYRRTAHDGVRLELADPAFAANWVEARRLFSDDHGNFYCRAGRASFVITPVGEMNVCLNLPLPAAHPFEIGFKNAWAAVRKFVEAAPPTASECTECPSRMYCQVCPGWSYCDNSTLDGPVAYLCEVARMRQLQYPQTLKP